MAIDPGIRSILTLDEEQLKAIGCVAVESAYLDDFLDTHIQYLSALDESDFRIFINNAQLMAKVDLLRNLSKSRLNGEQFADSHRRAFDEIKEAVTERNKVIHSTWRVERMETVKDQNGELVWIPLGKKFATRKNRGKAGFERYEPKNIMDVAVRLDAATRGLAAFLQKSGLFPPKQVRVSAELVSALQNRNWLASLKEPPPGPKKAPE